MVQVSSSPDKCRYGPSQLCDVYAPVARVSQRALGSQTRKYTLRNRCLSWQEVCKQFRVVLVAALILSSVVLFSSEDSHESIQPDPNTYQPFKAMNTLIMERQHETLTNLANTKGMLSINRKGLY